MALIAKKKKEKRQKRKETPEARAERLRQLAFSNANRSIFEMAGFRRLAGVDGAHFEFQGIKSELDDIFVYENVILFVEYTTSTGANLSSHAKGKSGSHNAIAAKPFDLFQQLAGSIQSVSGAVKGLGYAKAQLIFRVIYCSDEAVEPHHQAFMPNTKFVSRAERTYFRKITGTIKRSGRYELFEFLDIPTAKVGKGGVIPSGNKTDRYHGTVLPEGHSNFPSGFTVASFYVDPEAILKRAYVLRQGGWRDTSNLYQRMISPGKVRAIRQYLRDQKRVFANNVVLTLPDDTEFRSVDDIAVDASELSETTPAWIALRDRPNSVGIIDGQHRVFSYYEDTAPDELIDKYRQQQNLLATGIVYPKGLSSIEREQFEAELFLEINSNQSGARSELKQAIWLILDPARPISVARRIAIQLASLQPLGGILERSSYDLDRIRTATIVAYGIQPLVKRSGKDSLFSIWNDPEKARIAERGKDLVVLQRYLAFASEHTADFLVLVREAVGVKKWKQVKPDGDGILSVTTINSFLILMWKLIEAGHVTDTGLNVSLSKLANVDTTKYKSSQYAALAAKMLEAVTS